MAVLQAWVTKKEINGTEIQIKSATGPEKKKLRVWKRVHVIQGTMNGYVLGWHWG